MKQKTSKGLIIGIMLLSVLAMFLHGSTRASASSFEKKLQESLERKEELAQLQKAAEQRKKEFEAHQQETEELLNSLANDIQDMEVYLNQIDTEMNQVAERLDNLDQTITDKEESLKITEQQLADAIKTEEEQYDTMKKRIRYLYENGEEGIWDILINISNLSDLLNRAEYRMRIAQYDNNLLERYELSKEMVETNKGYLEASLTELYTLKAEAEFEMDSYMALSTEKAEQMEAYLAKQQLNMELMMEYGDEIVKQEKTIDEIYEMEETRMKEEEQIRKDEEERIRREEEERKRKAEEERKRQEEERKRLEEELRKQRLQAAADIELTLETSPYKMIWPLPGDYRVYDGFGPRKAPIAGASTFHRGVDIGGELRATVVAVLAGTVTASAYQWQNGNYVEIDHGNGIVTKYCHFSKCLVSKGDFVMQGEPIGLVGSTGVSTAPHLHFGLLLNGTFVDPMKYLPYE